MDSTDNKYQLDLSLRESNALKGVAIMLLLFHHLFLHPNGLYDETYIMGVPVANTISQLCKICIAIFVLLSGYACGKTVQIGSMADVWAFYKRRFKKLFVNYWFIWLLFVPAGVFVFGRTFGNVYAQPVVRNFILDLFGMIHITGQYGYNSTWWFYTCIIMLYIVFPALTALVARWPKSIWLLLAASFGLAFVHNVRLSPVSPFLLPFVLGMALNQDFIARRLSKVSRFIGEATPVVGILVVALLAVGLGYLKLSGAFTFLWDTLSALLLVLVYKSVSVSDRLNLGLEFLGRHSFNIFLFHTFLYPYFLSSLICWNRNPVVIFFTLLLSCVVISVGIERLKKLTGVDRI